MMDAHIASGAGVTVAGIRVPRSGGQFVRRDPDQRRHSSWTTFLEKPADPPGLPDSPDESFVSMGNYLFTTQATAGRAGGGRRERRVAPRHGPRHHPGAGRPRATPPSTTSPATCVPGETERDHGYWRDVGTIDSYYDAHTDLISDASGLQPLQPAVADPGATQASAPAAKFVEGGTANQSIVSPGCIISGAQVVGSVLSPDVLVESGAVVQGVGAARRCPDRRGAVVRAGDPGQERRSSRRARTSVSTWPGTASTTTSPSPGSSCSAKEPRPSRESQLVRRSNQLLWSRYDRSERRRSRARPGACVPHPGAGRPAS